MIILDRLNFVNSHLIQKGKNQITGCKKDNQEWNQKIPPKIGTRHNYEGPLPACTAISFTSVDNATKSEYTETRS
jgi:hypothetical protein